jgi:hypothetical protein
MKGTLKWIGAGAVLYVLAWIVADRLWPLPDDCDAWARADWDNREPCPDCDDGLLYQDSMVAYGVPGGRVDVGPCPTCDGEGFVTA